MKTVINEYAGVLVGFIATGMFLSVLGFFVFQKNGMLVVLIDMVLGSGV